MGYTKYEFQIVKLDHAPYWPRAEKPMDIVVKEWDKAIMVSRMWHSERMRQAYFGIHDETAKSVRPTLILSGEGFAARRGASFTQAEQWEDVPQGDNESDLEDLAIEAKRRYNEATIENTASRIKMMLGMLGDVREVDDVSGINLYRLSQNAHDFKVFEVKGQKLVLFGGDG
jgi:hypothetical protein